MSVMFTKLKLTKVLILLAVRVIDYTNMRETLIWHSDLRIIFNVTDVTTMIGTTSDYEKRLIIKWICSSGMFRQRPYWGNC